ncbi:dockerin type I domain-containing protein [Pseudobacteroides cellulosolvens]|uniref:Dockerin domain-containing protein n=1 Tax=Pseudobacteroides cellulosolvens ATCC 35603 = DSM 2933 TaxID=398512 RepID=A0A0L6JY18_9FIRM|nr:dockerin type I domain-containing protein [Pseudobacteroides cellulosolvens]KNY30347.1 hypothetical protein Bccel_5627 [Pseudobacteroides cellulosolvens ATCC 35603 = DSM 2933]
MSKCKRKTKKVFLLLLVMVQIASLIIPGQSANAATLRLMEKLDRGLVAVKVSNGVFVSWRMFGTDPTSIAFNIYRNGTKLNSTPITTSTNYLDASGTTGSTYTVRPVINGQEQVDSEKASVWGQNYLTVPIKAPVSGYTAGDCSTGDLDGDGQYEVVIKWEGRTQDNANAGVTDPVCLEAYKLNGTRLWTINLGRNIRGGAHYTQFLVADFDSDGKSEVVCKTADGTKDGKGKVIGDANANYVTADGYILTGPEYLTVFSGVTGEALATANYDPPRGTVSSWGDNYGNRVDRFLACVGYLDGVHPSIVMCRGYYTRLTIAAWDFRSGKLTKRWFFDSNNNTKFAGQGNHNLSVGDVDNDGKDEIIYGACAVDDDGKGMYTTNLGHGDSMHFGDLNPNRAGLEVWTCHEGEGGADLHDARTGTILFRWNADKDTGRACTADIVASSPGEEMWAAGSPLFSATGQNLGTAPGVANHAIWWDGDELRELLDGTTITKYGSGTLLSATGCTKINGTKSNPNLQADILGDWREELICKTSDETALRIYTTTNVTNRRIYTLMHDPIYRNGIAWQNVAYNQPPHTGFFIGSGMTVPPVPQIALVGDDGPSTPPTSTPTNTPTKSPTNTPTQGIVSAPEDINGDKVVNMSDVILMASHFNAVSTDSNYDRKCDVNGDGAINMSDVIMVAAKFNKSV